MVTLVREQNRRLVVRKMGCGSSGNMAEEEDNGVLICCITLLQPQQRITKAVRGQLMAPSLLKFSHLSTQANASAK